MFEGKMTHQDLKNSGKLFFVARKEIAISS